MTCKLVGGLFMLDLPVINILGILLQVGKIRVSVASSVGLEIEKLEIGRDTLNLSKYQVLQCKEASFHLLPSRGLCYWAPATVLLEIPAPWISPSWRIHVRKF